MGIAALATCRSLSGSLLQSIEDDDTATTTLLLEQQPGLIFWRKFGEGVTPLHIAAAKGRPGAVEAIVRVSHRSAARSSSARKASALVHALLNQKNGAGQTALMLACRGRHPEVVRFLLDAGADPLLFDAIHSKTCLHYAVLGGSPACCEELLGDRTVVRCRDRGGFQRLRDVCVADSQGYHRFVDVRTVYAFAPLHVAACLGLVDVARVLVRYGANLSVRCTGVMSFSTLGYRPPWKPFATPMHIAVANHNYELVRVLLDALASGDAVSSQDLRMLPDYTGSRPVDIARRTNQQYLVDLLDPSIPLRSVWLRLHPAGTSGPSMGAPALKCLAAKSMRSVLYQQLLRYNIGSPAIKDNGKVEHVGMREDVQQQQQQQQEELNPRTASHSEARCGPGSPQPLGRQGGANSPRRRSLSSLLRRSNSLDSRRPEIVVMRGLDDTLAGRGVQIAAALPDHASMAVAGNNTDHGGALYADLILGGEGLARQQQQPPHRRVGNMFWHARSQSGGVTGAYGSSVSLASDGMECAICCDAPVSLKAGKCGHQLCVQCAMHLVDPEWDTAPSCPYCRSMIVSFSAL